MHGKQPGGTTRSCRDAWLVGMTPRLAVLTWVVLATVATSCGSATDTDESATSATTAAPTTLSTTTTTTSTTTTSTTTTTTTVPMLSPEECVATIPLEIRLGQLLFPVVTQGEFDEVTRLAEAGSIAGVVVLGQPTASIADRIEEVQAASLIGPSIMAVDEEGGRVQRVAGLVGEMPPARSVAQNSTVPEARAMAADHARRLRELGFTMNLAPVLDLDLGSFVRDRSYGSDPDVVSAYGVAVARGITDGGLTPVAKHFPGHGRGIDSHTGLPTIPAVEDLRSSDLKPFDTIIRLGDTPIMIGHLVVPGLTGELPATLSSEAINGLLRRDMGFNGLVMTDAFNMDAISRTHNNAQAAELAIEAGVDLVMLGRVSVVEPTIDALVDAVGAGRISEQTINESVLRVLDTKGLEVCDIPAEVRPAIACDGVTSGGCSLVG